MEDPQTGWFGQKEVGRRLAPSPNFFISAAKEDY